MMLFVKLLSLTTVASLKNGICSVLLIYISQASTATMDSIASVDCSLKDGVNIEVGRPSNNNYNTMADEDDDEIELSWRLDSKKSLSDWVLLVTTKETSACHVYNVHKNVLAVGPRKSLYFARAFALHNKRRQQEQHEQKRAQSHQHTIKSPFPKSFPFRPSVEPCELITQTLRQDRRAEPEVTRSNQMVTKLELPQLAADNLPQLLDYIYSGGGTMDINAQNAVPLQFLADFFEVKALRRIVSVFWQQDLCVENLCWYYQQAASVGSSSVMNFAQEYCARNLFDIPEDMVVQVLTAIDANFFYNVVSYHAAIGQNGQSIDSEGIKEEEKSNKATPIRDIRAQSSTRLSLIVAVYCNIHRQDLSANMFSKIVGQEILPEVDVKAAKVLLELEYHICRSKDKLTSLKVRCIKVMSRKWETVCTDSQNPGAISLPQLEGEALERFVALCLTNAKERLSSLDQIYQEWDKVQSELKRLRVEVRKLRHEKKQWHRLDSLLETNGNDDIDSVVGASSTLLDESVQEGAFDKATKNKSELQAETAPPTPKETSVQATSEVSTGRVSFSGVTEVHEAKLQAQANEADSNAKSTGFVKKKVSSLAYSDTGPKHDHGLANKATDEQILSDAFAVVAENERMINPSRAAHDRYQMEANRSNQLYKATPHTSAESRQGKRSTSSSNASFSDYGSDSVTSSRFEAIDMARSRHQTALSAYEEAIAKLAQSTMVESESPSVPSYKSRDYNLTPSQAPTPASVPDHSYNQLQRDYMARQPVSPRIMRPEAWDETPTWASQQVSAIPVASPDVSTARESMNAFQHRMANHLSQINCQTVPPSPVPQQAPPSHFVSPEPVMLHSYYDEVPREVHPSFEKASQRSQEFIKDAASTAKSLFSFTQNFLRSSKFAVPEAPGSDAAPAFLPGPMPYQVLSVSTKVPQDHRQYEDPLPAPTSVLRVVSLAKSTGSNGSSMLSPAVETRQYQQFQPQSQPQSQSLPQEPPQHQQQQQQRSSSPTLSSIARTRSW
jgi:hypothetical protein